MDQSTAGKTKISLTNQTLQLALQNKSQRLKVCVFKNYAGHNLLFYNTPIHIQIQLKDHLANTKHK